MYAKEVITRLLLAQKTAKEISEVVGCHLSIVYRVKKFLQDASKPRKPGSGRPRIARTSNVIKSVRAKIARNPVRSIRKLAVEANISERSMRRVIKDDLHASSRARVKRHLITKRVKELRVSRSKRLLSVLKKGKIIILFSDEKLFSIDAVSNSRTDRFISAKKLEDVPEKVKFSFQTKHPAGVMIFGLMASNGLKMPPVFIDAGVKINTEVYIGILKDKVLPWVKANFSADQYVVLQQDGAPCHTSNRTQQ